MKRLRLSANKRENPLRDRITRTPLATLHLLPARLAGIGIIVLCSFCSIQAQVQQTEDNGAERQRVVGVGKSLPFVDERESEPIVQIDVGDDSIVKVYQYNESSFVITGLKLGVTSIVLWRKASSGIRPTTFDVRVDTTPTLATLARVMQEFITSNFDDRADDITINPTPTLDKLVVNGKVKNQKVATAIIAAIESFQLPASSIVDNLRVK